MRPPARIALAATALACSLPGSAVAALPQQTGALDLLTQANLRLDGRSSGDLTARVVAGAGDVNGDGRADVIVGARQSDNNGRTNSGSAYVIFGTAGTGAVDLASLGAAGFRIDGAAANDYAGTAVAGAGDVNGDGRADLVVGAYSTDNNGRTDSGSAYVIFGKADAAAIDLGSLGAGGYRIDGAEVADWAGSAVAGAGDVNGDGRPDVLVGANAADNNGRSTSGSAYVVFGDPDATTIDLAGLGAAGFRVDGAAVGHNAGFSVGAAGDLNGDDRGDVIVGAPLAGNNGRPSSGSAYVVFGRTSTATIDLAGLGASGFRIDGAVAGDRAGYSADGAGDVNGDGRPDIVMGAYWADNNGRTTSGSAYVVFGPASPVTIDLAGLGAAGFRIDGAAAGGLAGISVDGAGDVNGDGRPDVALGAPQVDNNGRTDSGSAYVVFGRTSTTTIDLAGLGASGFRIDGAGPGDQAGTSVAGAGDVNGDGRPDVLVGANWADNNSRPDAGSAYTAFGFGAPALGYAPLATTVGTQVTLAPTGVARTGPASYSVSPALPAGLRLDPATGVVGGAPLTAFAATTFTVTMSDLAGSTTAPLVLAVADAAAAHPPGRLPARDVTGPRISLKPTSRMRIGRPLRVRVRCDEPCRLVAAVAAGPRARRARANLGAGRWTWVRLAPPPRPAGSAAARRLVLTLRATDAAGNTSTLRRRVTAHAPGVRGAPRSA